MGELFRKMLCIVTILLALLSSLRFQQALGDDIVVDQDHQEENPQVRDDGRGIPVWWNVTADVWGYYQVGQSYYHTEHSVAMNQGPRGRETTDFQFWIVNLTNYGLDSNGQIVYRNTAQVEEWLPEYNDSISYGNNVYSAFTYINVTVRDLVEGTWAEFYYVNLTAWVSRRDDVAISNVTTSPSEVYPCENVSITVDVDNEGAVTETFNVTVYRNDTAIETQTVSDLAPGNGTTLTFNWNPTGVTSGDYEIKAEASVVPGESDTDDNTYPNGTVKVLNQPPNTPSKPSGEESGITSAQYTYFTNTTDLNDDDVRYQFEWGDGKNTTTDWYQSGATASASHIWYFAGMYNVTARAQDSYYMWSDWSSPLEVNISTGSGSGCPFVYVWNGTDFVIDNNLLADSITCGGEEVEDYYKLEQNLVPSYEGENYSLYFLRLAEFQQEHSYFDQVQLMTVDHDSGINVAVSPFGEILTYQSPYAPLSVIDDQGHDHIEVIQDIDDSYYEGYNGSYLLLNFGEVNAETAKLVMRADRPPLKQSIHIQVLDLAGNWMDVVAIIPRTYWATEIVDLSTYLPSAGEFEVRLYFTDSHKVDFVGLDTTTQAQIDVEQASLLLAYHSNDGIVTAKLRTDEDIYTELTPGQQITLLFAATTQNGEQRTFIIYVKGYYFTISS